MRRLSNRAAAALLATATAFGGAVALTRTAAAQSVPLSTVIVDQTFSTADTGGWATWFGTSAVASSGGLLRVTPGTDGNATARLVVPVAGRVPQFTLSMSSVPATSTGLQFFDTNWTRIGADLTDVNPPLDGRPFVVNAPEGTAYLLIGSYAQYAFTIDNVRLLQNAPTATTTTLSPTTLSPTTTPIATTTTTPGSSTTVPNGLFLRTFEVALTGGQNVSVECPLASSYSPRMTLSGTRTQVLTFDSPPTGPCILSTTVTDPPVAVPPFPGLYDLAHWAYSIRPAAAANVGSTYLSGDQTSAYYDLRDNLGVAVRVSTISASEAGSLPDRPTLSVPITGSSETAAVTFALTRCTWGTFPGGTSPLRACTGVVTSINYQGTVVSGPALAAWSYVDGNRSVPLFNDPSVTVVAPDNRALSLTRPTGSETLLEFRADLRMAWNTNEAAQAYPEFTCLLAGSPFPTIVTFAFGTLKSFSVQPNVTCRFNVVSLTAIHSRTGRVALRRTVNGVTTELSASDLAANSFSFTVGGAGSKTVVTYAFDYDQPVPADIVLDTFGNGSSWTTWYGSATSTIDGYFTGGRQGLHVTAPTGTRAVKTVVDVAGRGPKLEVNLTVIAGPSAQLQIYDANWQLLRSQNLTFTPTNIGFQRSVSATTVDLPAGAARLLFGVTGAADFGIDGLRVTDLGGAVLPSTTTPVTTTVTTTRVQTTTVPTTTGPPTTASPTTTSPTTTSPTTRPTTTTPAGAFAISVPATAAVGQTVTFSASGALPAAGVVDFSANGIPIGTGLVQSNGTASISNALWARGSVTVVARWTRYVGGVPIVVSVSRTITVT